MNRNLTIGVILFSSILWSIDVPIDEVKKQRFNESISTTSQVIQLPSATEQINAQMGGKVVKYLVKEGDSIKKGQLIAEIKSLELASFISELKGLKKQLTIINKNHEITQKLYDIGVESLQKLNQQEEEREQVISKINTIKSRLLVVGAVGDRYKLYATTKGRVDKILSPLNSVVGAETALVSIIKGKESFLIKSFIPLKYATKIRLGQQGSITYGAKEYKMKITQILPTIDAQTQKMTVLSKLYSPVNNLFVNTFLDSKLFFTEGKTYLTVKKSALSFFNNEWVVFVPEHHDDHENHAHDEHEDHEEEEVPYDIRVIKILKEHNGYVAIEGLKEHQDYVSDKSYYIKSLLLKSSLGGHGH